MWPIRLRKLIRELIMRTINGAIERGSFNKLMFNEHELVEEIEKIVTNKER